MIRRTLWIGFAVAMIVLVGCSGGYVAIYDIALVEMERPANAVKDYGTDEINIVDERGLEVSYFEDDLVKVAWVLTAQEFSFELTNKWNSPIEIVWDKAAFVDETGKRHRVVHSGVTLSKLDKPQPPTLVNVGGRVSDSVQSAGNVHYESGIHGKWREEPFFPASGNQSEELEREAEQYVGANVQVVLPLRVADNVNEYVFGFRVEDVDISKE